MSSEDAEIIEIAKSLGGDVPYTRPEEYAKDDSHVSDTVNHAVAFVKQGGEVYDAVAVLEPTSPLRKAEDIDSAISKFLSHPDCDSLVSVGEVHMEHPRIIKRIKGGFVKPYLSAGTESIYRRQQLEPVYFPYGVIYLAKTAAYFRLRTFYMQSTIPYFIERWQNYEVDDSDDLTVCEAMMRKHLLGETP